MITVIKIDDGGKKIIADIPYDGGRGPKLAKSVPGASAKWDKTVTPNKFLGWTYPLTLETCFTMRMVFGADLAVSNDLADWARIEIKKRNELEALREGNIKNQSLDLLAAEAPQLYLAMQSRTYQPAGTAFMVAGRRVILGDEPGLGKTIQSLGAIIQSDARVILVACRKSATTSVWERETERWTDTIAPYVAQGSRAEREAIMANFKHDVEEDKIAGWPHPRRMLIINLEMMRAKRQEVCPEGLDPDFCNSRPSQARGDHRHSYHSYPDWPGLFDIKYDAIIVDEAHNVLASTANVQSKRITQSRFGAMQVRGLLADDGLAIALSGTPFRSNLTNGWGTLNWLEPKTFSSYWRWAETHFNVTEEQAGRRLVKVIDGGSKTPEPRDQDAFNRMLRPYYLGRKKAEVAADLPEIIFAGTPQEDYPDGPCYVRLPMDDKQAKTYYQMLGDAEADIEGGRVMAVGILAEMTRRRQFATSFGKVAEGGKVLPALPSNKIEWILDFMDERRETDAKVVIASNFTEVVELAAEVLRKAGWEVLTLTGATSKKNRDRLVERFQDPDDSLRVVILNTKAGGESITLDRADEMIVIDDPWKSDTSKQLYDRIHRVSRVHQVTIYRLLSIGTIEEDIANLNEEQRRALEAGDVKVMAQVLRKE